MLWDAEVFVFTDNTVAEATFYERNSPSQALIKLVLRLRKLEVMESICLWVLHVSGKRMIVGIDGLSWGDIMESVTQGFSSLLENGHRVKHGCNAGIAQSMDG